MAEVSRSDYFFGIADQMNNGKWQLAPRFRLVRYEQNLWRRGENCSPQEFPPAGRVFSANPLRVGHPYFFQVEEERQWTRKQRHDRYRVVNGLDGPWCWPFGNLILPQAEATAEHGLLIVDRRWSGCAVYLYSPEAKGELIGPWKVENDGHLLAIDPRVCVFRFPIDDIDDDNSYVWRNPYIGMDQKFLLNDPPLEKGTPLDVLSNMDLADWFVDQLRLQDGVSLADLDARSPQWSEVLRKQFDRFGDPILKTLASQRWQRTQALLDAIRSDETALQAILSTVQFRDLLDQAIVAEIDRRTSALEDQARQEALARQKELTKENTRLESYQNELRKDCDRKQIERDNLHEQIEHRQDELRQALADATQHMDAARQRLRDELQALQANLGPIAPLLRVTPIAAVAPSPNDELEGAALGDPVFFLNKRLGPCLQLQVGAVPEGLVKGLHLAVLCQRWTLVPSPQWASAYNQALGGTGRLLVTHVEATWLDFRSAWSAEVAAFWQQAVADPGNVYLLLFHEINRALVPCWAGSWLDTLAGLRDTLPSEPPQPWPTNLRVLATLAEDPATLPLYESVLMHWAAIRRQSGKPGSILPPIAPGHVPGAIWQGWAEEGLARCLHDLGENEEDAPDWERRLREEWPREYLTETSHARPRPASVLA